MSSWFQPLKKYQSVDDHYPSLRSTCKVSENQPVLDTPNGDGSARITGFWFQLSNIAVVSTLQYCSQLGSSSLFTGICT